MKHIVDEFIHQDFILAKKAAYIPSGLDPLSLAKEESTEYGALTFSLNDRKIKFRVGKVTPSKLGHFVTIWKRDCGVTKPHHIFDPIDLFIISVRDDDGFGQFIFHKSLLLKHDIVSSDIREGKRGIRVYAPWIKTLSKQAQKTQLWQCQHFIKFDCSKNQSYPNLIKAIAEPYIYK
jgi:hypothetical protein